MAAPGPQQLQQQQQMLQQQQQQAAADRQNQGQREREALERTARSIFVGNIPYEASEERLKEMFEQAGPVIGFRLVYDRETGKPKGYGFCEYKDLPTAQAALRNLQNIEFCGRPLRIGPAAGEQNQQQQQQQDPQGHGAGASGPPVDSPYGEKVDPKNAPEEISRAVASLPPEQMFELMRQMKQCIQNNPHEARNMLLQNPQLAYALLQAQIVMKLVDPKVAIAMLSRTTEQIPPVMPADHPMHHQQQPLHQQHYQQPQPPPMQQQPMYHHQPPPPPPPQQMYPPMQQQQQQQYRQPPPPPPPPQPAQQPQPQSSQGAGLSMGAIAGGDQEKAALIMQVLQLSDEQIHMLPEDQRRSIMILKEQLAKAGHI